MSEGSFDFPKNPQIRSRISPGERSLNQLLGYTKGSKAVFLDPNRKHDDYDPNIMTRGELSRFLGRKVSEEEAKGIISEYKNANDLLRRLTEVLMGVVKMKYK